MPDVSYSFKRTGDTETYDFQLSKTFAVDTLLLEVRAYRDAIKEVLVDGKPASWSLVPDAVGYPRIEVKVASKDLTACHITIEWEGEAIRQPQFNADAPMPYLMPQQGQMRWIAPHDQQGAAAYVPTIGSVRPAFFEKVDTTCLEPIALTAYYNDSITNLFTPRYWSPRPKTTSLQIPLQGFAEWCHPKATFEVIDDALRAADTLQTTLGVPFLTAKEGNNILFTTRWDNFPESAIIPLSGQASHAYLMMAGSTNAMQSRIENGIIRVVYADNTVDSLYLTNPETWCPIEQDFYDDGLAFRLRMPRPYRVHLQSGKVSRTLSAELGAKPMEAPQSIDLNSTGIFGKEIKGGAGVLLDIPLQSEKELKHIELETLSNDVLIGIISITLQRCENR